CAQRLMIRPQCRMGRLGPISPCLRHVPRVRDLPQPARISSGRCSKPVECLEPVSKCVVQGFSPAFGLRQAQAVVSLSPFESLRATLSHVEGWNNAALKGSATRSESDCFSPRLWKSLSSDNG